MFDIHFMRFIQKLSESENTLEVFKDAFSELADQFRFGEVRVRYTKKETINNPDGVDENISFFLDKGDIDENNVIKKEFHTAEDGIESISLVALKNAGLWTEEEKNALDIIIDIFFFHISKTRLINAVEQSAYKDYLTELPNSNGYFEFAKNLYERNELAKYNAFYFDLKGFGLVNVKFGKEEADIIICRYVSVLKQFIADDECLGRIAGDNFVALIRKERSEEFLKLIENVETFAYVDKKMTTVDISAVAGVLEIDEKIEDYRQLISQCSIAYDVAKYVTKRPYMYLTKEMNQKALKQKQVRSKFKQAIMNEEFVIYYQPKVETDTYSLAGAEALVRWVSDDKLISPGEFIPLIEEDGLICELDFYMLKHVCHDINMWKVQGIEPVRVSVNFSRRHLLNPDFPQKIIDTISEHGVNPKYIEIEITETADEEESDMLNIFMKEMKDHGIATAIDDFGTGVSSFNILRNSQVDVLKIDKSLIDDAVMTESDIIVISNIIKMARELDVDVITEGVERWEQVEFLHDIDCHLIQGFLFDRPMPEKEYTERLRKRTYDITKVNDVESK